MKRLLRWWRPAWSALRAVTGDDAYERYLAHCRRRHPELPPLDRAAFYAAELGNRWQRVNRCC
jgi:uncharacterized short protein YbdD (DUF466 family)